MNKKSKIMGKSIEFISYSISSVLLLIIGYKSVINIDNVEEFLLKVIFIPIVIFLISYVLSTIFHEFGHLIARLYAKMEFVEYNFLFFSIYK